MGILYEGGRDQIARPAEANRQQRFSEGWALAEAHMPAIRTILGNLPSKIFFDIDTAPANKDLEQATDLVLSVSGGDIAVRVRRRRHWEKAKMFSIDWSVRAVCRGHRTEIDKLRDGFGRWYFTSFSSDDAGNLIAWWLIDLDKVRETGILDEDQWPVHPNGDGTSGKYISIDRLIELDCIVASYDNFFCV